MKKLLSVFLCLTVWLSAFAYDFWVDGIYYTIIGDGQVKVTMGGNYYGSVVIPSSVTYTDYNHVTHTYTVTSIDSLAFQNCSGLTSVTIPNSVTSIRGFAFRGCSGLTSVTIPNSVTYIGVGAFSSCSGLTSVTIPNSVTFIGGSVFSNCSGLTSVTIPNSVTSIGNGAFYYCRSLTSVTIPNSVTSIGSGAFYYCSSLTSVTIPNSVTSIGTEVFYGCSGLTTVTMPNSVTSIEDYAFYGCSGLISLTIPSSVTYIGKYVFGDCTNITDITCHATNPPIIKSNTFDRYDATLYVPASSIALYKSAEYWKNFYIRAISGDGLEYNLADRNVIYCNDIVYNEDGLDIKLFDASGRLISSGNGNIEMSSCPNGIYIVTDGKGGFLKINHYR